MSNSRQQLAKAYELIQRDRVDEAIAIIKPITEAEPQNADAFWLLANASSEARDARRALITVLKINPAYPKARQLLEQLNEVHPPRDDELMQMMDIEDVDTPLPSGTPESEFVDDLFADDLSDVETVSASPAKPKGNIDDLFSTQANVEDDFGIEEDDPFAALLDEDGGGSTDSSAKSPQPRRRRRIWTLLLLLMFICLCLVLAVVFSGGSSPAPSTPSAGLSSWIPALAATVQPTNEGALDEVRLAAQQDAQATLAADAEALFIPITDNKYALVIRLCTEPSPSLPRIVQEAMQLVAVRIGTTPAVQADLTMVGVTLEDCTRGNDVLYRVLTPMSSAIAYSANPSDPALFTTFRQAWVVEN